MQAERRSLALLEQKLVTDRHRAAAEQRANDAIAARLESEQAACLAAKARADAEQEKADLGRQLEVAEEIAAQSALDKANAQRLLLDRAHAHAEMQRKVAQTTQAMAEAKRQLLALEIERHKEAAQALAGVQGKLVKHSSENLTREVIGRLTQPSAA